MVRHFLQTIPKSKCTELQPIWTALPEVIRTFMRFLGAKNPHRKYKGFRPMVKNLPHVFSHNFWTERFQGKFDHFLKPNTSVLVHYYPTKNRCNIFLLRQSIGSIHRGIYYPCIYSPDIGQNWKNSTFLKLTRCIFNQEYTTNTIKYKYSNDSW